MDGERLNEWIKQIIQEMDFFSGIAVKESAGMRTSLAGCLIQSVENQNTYDPN